MKIKINAKPRYLHNDDVLKGYIVLHKSFRKNAISHLEYVKVKCHNTGKTIICRLFGPGTQGKYFQGNFEKINKENSIFIDAYYRDKLGINAEDVGEKVYEFSIINTNQSWLTLCAAMTSPNLGVKCGTIFGIISLYLTILFYSLKSNLLSNFFEFIILKSRTLVMKSFIFPVGTVVIKDFNAYLYCLFLIVFSIRLILNFFKAWAIVQGEADFEDKVNDKGVVYCEGIKFSKQWNFLQAWWFSFWSWGKNNHIDDYFLPSLIGFVELLLYPFFMITKQWIFVGMLIGLKTAVNWGKWQEIRTSYNRFLFGNLLVIISSVFLMTAFFTITENKTKSIAKQYTGQN